MPEENELELSEDPVANTGVWGPVEDTLENLEEEELAVADIDEEDGASQFGADDVQEPEPEGDEGD